MTGISASAKQGAAVATPTFCASVANLAESVCGITENAAQVSSYTLLLLLIYPVAYFSIATSGQAGHQSSQKRTYSNCCHGIFHMLLCPLCNVLHPSASYPL